MRKRQFRKIEKIVGLQQYEWEGIRQVTVCRWCVKFEKVVHANIRKNNKERNDIINRYTEKRA